LTALPQARKLLLAACLVLSSCGWLEPPPQVRGNRIEPDGLKELVIGTSTKADVAAVVGSPTAHDTFDDNTWLYISEVTQDRIANTQAELDQNVVVMRFDDKGLLKSIEKLNKSDALPVTVVAHTTPSPGTEASFLQQLLGNIGRFNPVSGLGNTTAGPNGSGGAPMEMPRASSCAES
jgi:outer membrane protein assembly factor BamE (lipoprotein component of BamABCDE complex)